MNSKINCQHIKYLFNTICCNQATKITRNTTTTSEQLNCNKISFNTHSTLAVHGNDVLAEKLIQDIRTYICAHGKCHLHYNRSHRRRSNHLWNKMLILSTNIKQIINLANRIVSIETHNNQMQIGRLKQKDNCVYCNNPKLTGIIHIHFVREYKMEEEKVEYEPIETVFTQIDAIANENASKIRSKEGAKPPGRPIKENNCHRMSYGDINYLGNNKALLYFYRGIRGTQTFANSMYPLEQQPKHKDLIVVDDIVFTSACKCDSILQHRKMFPHYRITCAVGLTCPARLNIFEREIYKRSRNASTEMFTKASSMLARYWK